MSEHIFSDLDDFSMLGKISGFCTTFSSIHRSDSNSVKITYKHLKVKYEKAKGKKKINFYPCLSNSDLCHRNIWGNGCIDPHNLQLCSSWREVSGKHHTPVTLPLGKVPPVPLYRRLGGPQSVWTMWRGEKSRPVMN
jgi:hypothetical protein